MTLTEADESWANVKTEGFSSTKTVDLESMPSRLQPVLAPKALPWVLQTPIPNVIDYALAERLQVVRVVPVGENSCIDEFEGVEEERNRLEELVRAYKMGNERIERTMQGKEVAMKEMIWSLMDFERTMNRRKTERGLLMKVNKENIYYSLQTATSNGHTVNRLLIHISPVHLTVALNAQKAVPEYRSREAAKVIQLIFELNSKWEVQK